MVNPRLNLYNKLGANELNDNILIMSFFPASTMSFGESSSSTAVSFKSFVTEGEVEEQRQRRQAEWERVRKPEDPLGNADRLTHFDRDYDNDDKAVFELTTRPVVPDG